MDLSSAVALNNGVRIPWVGFGVFQVEPGQPTRRSVLTALQVGYRHLDTASLYRNEADVGLAVRDSGLPRDQVFVTTKVWNDDQGYESTLRAFQASKARLGLGPVDLYLIHWPAPDRSRETYRAMQRLYRDGEARAIGVSNFLVHHLEQLMEEAEVLPAVDQVEFHPFLLQPDLLGFCRQKGIRLEAWSPLTRGRLLDHPVIGRIAASHGRTAAQILLRWDLQHEVITLPRSTRESHIRENARIFDFQLSGADMSALDALDEGRRIGPNPDLFPG